MIVAFVISTFNISHHDDDDDDVFFRSISLWEGSEVNEISSYKVFFLVCKSLNGVKTDISKRQRILRFFSFHSLPSSSVITSRDSRSLKDCHRMRSTFHLQYNNSLLSLRKKNYLMHFFHLHPRQKRRENIEKAFVSCFMVKILSNHLFLIFLTTK